MFNSVHLLGRLGQDPEVIIVKNDLAIANLSVATNGRKKENDKWVKTTEWHRVVVFGKTAEFIGHYGGKGAIVLVEGRLQTRKWEDKSGQSRYTTEVIGSNLQLVSKPNGNGNGNGDAEPESPKPAAKPAPAYEDRDEEDDLPF